MTNADDENLLGERVLTGSRGEEVIVRVYGPKPSSEAVDYECVYVISGPGVDIRRPIKGLDAIQAIQLALLVIGADLAAIERRSGGAMTWRGGEHGFPIA